MHQKSKFHLWFSSFLKLNKAPQADAGDALAGAICHALSCTLKSTKVDFLPRQKFGSFF